MPSLHFAASAIPSWEGDWNLARKWDLGGRNSIVLHGVYPFNLIRGICSDIAWQRTSSRMWFQSTVLKASRTFGLLLYKDRRPPRAKARPNLKVHMLLVLIANSTNQ